MTRNEILQILEKATITHMNCHADCCPDDKTLFSTILSELETAGVIKSEEMTVIENDSVLPFDVDKTLVFWKPENMDEHEFDLKVDYYGESISVTPHLDHIRLLKSSLARGRQVIVWSGNGFQWAKNVIEALKESGYLTTTKGIYVMSKPIGYVDDLDAKDWMGNRIYIPAHSNPYSEE